MIDWFLSLFLIVPILVHLFYFRRTKTIYFSSIQFLKATISHTKQKTRLKQILIFFTRIVSFIILLLFIHSCSKSTEIIKGNGSALFLLDNSLSQSESTQGISNFNKGKKFVLDGMESLSTSFLLSNDDYRNFNLTSQPKEAISSRLEKLSYSGSAFDMNKLLIRFSDARVKDRFIISDFQNINENLLAELGSDSANNYFLLPSGIQNVGNAFIDSLYVYQKELETSSMAIKCWIRSAGYSGKLSLKFYNKKRQTYSSIVEVGNGLNELELNIPRQISDDEFYVLISGDGVEFDNVFYFNLQKKQKIKVGVLSGEHQKYLESVYTNNEFFDVTVIEDQIEYDLIEGLDLVVMEGIQKIPDGIDNFNNTSFIVFPPDSVNKESYEKFLNLKVSKSKSLQSQEIEFDFNDPLFSNVFEKKSSEYSLPFGTGMFQFNQTYNPIIPYRDGKPFLIKERNIYFINSPLSQEYSNLIDHSIFLPLMYKIAFEEQNYKERVYYYPGDYIKFPETQRGDVPIKLIGEEIEVFVEYLVSENDLLVKIPEFLLPGYYQLYRNDNLIAKIAVNIAKEESQFNGLQGDKLENQVEAFTNVSVLEYPEGGKSFQIGTMSNSSHDTWKYLLILAIVFLSIEVFLHRFYK